MLPKHKTLAAMPLTSCHQQETSQLTELCALLSPRRLQNVQMLNTEVTRTLKAEDVTSHRAFWTAVPLLENVLEPSSLTSGVADYMCRLRMQSSKSGIHIADYPILPKSTSVIKSLNYCPQNGNNFPWDTVNRANCRLQNLSVWDVSVQRLFFQLFHVWHFSY